MSSANPREGNQVIENRLRERRRSAGLSQKELAEMAGITRQAVCAMEADQYSPATAVALQLARALRCRVEDLFSIRPSDVTIEGELLGPFPPGSEPVRAQLTEINQRLWVRPLIGVGELAGLAASADGLITGSIPRSQRVTVKLLKHREALRRKVVVGGCDPAMFLAAEYVGQYDQAELAPYFLGSSAALEALKRGQVHAAGIHLAEERAGAWDFPEVKRLLAGMDYMVVTFAHWEEGFIVRQGNPKKIRVIGDIVKTNVRIVNREKGSGARHLLDKQMQASAINPRQVKGYGDELLSHLDVASRIKGGLADVAISVRSAAAICGLDFIPLQRERYDLVIPKAYYETLPGLRALLDIIVTRRFRDELEALGGYDTRDTGKLLELAIE